MDVKQEILSRLDALASKLGTTATYLWHVLTKQGMMIGIQECLIGLVWLALWIAALKIGKHMRTNLAKKATYDDEMWTARGWIVTGLCQFFLIGVGCYLFEGITYIINPEFYALQTILQSLK